MRGIDTFKSCLLIASLGLLGCGAAEGGDSSSGHESAGGEEHAEAGEGHHGEHEAGDSGDDHHSQAPATVVAFHDVLAPAWHSEPGEGRGAAGCAAADEMAARADAVIAAPVPEQVTGSEEDWRSAGAALRASVAELSAACPSSDETEERLSAVHDAFHALTEQLSSHGH